jgi:hypothetical protein
MGESTSEPKPRSWGTALFAAIYLASLAGVLMKIVPKFSEVFRQVKIPTPVATSLLMTLSDVACAVPWIVYPMVILLPAGLSRLDKRQASVARTAISVGFALGAAGMLAALFLPLMSVSSGIGARHR